MSEEDLEFIGPVAKNECLQCGVRMTGLWQKKFCSKKCFGLHKTLPTTQCKVCGANMNRQRRPYCGRICKDKALTVSALERSDSSDTDKVCKKCGLRKSFSEFGKTKETVCGTRATCKTCAYEAQKHRVESSPESLKARRHGKKMCERKRAARDPILRMYMSAKHAHKHRSSLGGSVFNLDKSDITIPDACPVLGIPIFRNIDAELTSKRSHNSPSLDRLDNNLGYEKGNVAVISWRANQIKGDASLEELEMVLDYMVRMQK